MGFESGAEGAARGDGAVPGGGSAAAGGPVVVHDGGTCACSRRMAEEIAGGRRGKDGSLAEGLRERKKRAVRSAIERELLRLVLERGYEGATVDEVCARVGISKKTFFNYYPSKELALRGASVALPDPDALVAALEGSTAPNYLDALVGQMRGAEMPDDDEVSRLRDEVMQTMPELAYRGNREFSDSWARVAGVLRAFLGEHPERRLLADRPVEDEVAIAMSAAVSMARIGTMLGARSAAFEDPRSLRLLLLRLVGGGEELGCRAAPPS